MTEESGLDRRDALKTLLALGAAAPLAWTGTLPAQAAGLTSQQLAGQRVIYSYSGLTPPSVLLQQISAGQAAGVIFFGGNISSETQIASVIQQLNAGEKISGTILFDAKTQGIGVSPGHDLASQITPDIQKKVDDAMAAMVAGTLTTCTDKCGALPVQ